MVMSIIAAIMYTFSNACAHGVLASSTAANEYYPDTQTDRREANSPKLLSPMPIPNSHPVLINSSVRSFVNDIVELCGLRSLMLLHPARELGSLRLYTSQLLVHHASQYRIRTLISMNPNRDSKNSYGPWPFSRSS